MIILATTVFSQDKTKIGLSGSIQENQFGILIPFCIEEKFVLAPAFNVVYAEKVGSEFSIGLVPKYYIKKDKISPYLGLKLGAIINIPNSKILDFETKVDIVGGLAFGGEYFIDDNFSFGVEAQGNLTKSDKNSMRFGNADGINFNTATMIYATIYF